MINNENLPAIFSFSAATIIALAALGAICVNPKIPDTIINGAFGIASILAAGGAGAAHSNKKSEQDNTFYSSKINLANKEEDTK